MTVQEIVNRVWSRYFPPPEQPQTGRVCAGCHKVIGKHDRYRIRVAEHLDCTNPTAEGVPEPLRTMILKDAWHE